MIDQLSTRDPDPEPDHSHDNQRSDVALSTDRLAQNTANRVQSENRGVIEGETRSEDSLRASWDGLVHVHRQTIMVVFHRPGQPAIEQRMRWIPWEGRR